MIFKKTPANKTQARDMLSELTLGSRMEHTMTLKKCLLLSTLVFIALLFSQQAYAVPIADSSIAFSNLQINPAAGIIQFLGPWEAEAFAQASNSSGELKADFHNSTGGAADANAAVTFGTAHATADAGNITGTANSHVDLSGAVNQLVLSKGTGTLFNSFMITGVAGEFPVNFSMDLVHSLNLSSDPNALEATTDIIFSLEIDGTPVLFQHDSRSLSSSSISDPSASVNLSSNMMHDITVTADSEVHGETMIPEPSNFALMLTGFGLLVLLARRKVGYGRNDLGQILESAVRAAPTGTEEQV
jgi:hypothetical protein